MYIYICIPYAYTHKDSELFDKLWRHPRTLEILETLIGGKVDGLQTWMYFKPPGELGRDVHQNIFYSHANRGDIINASCAVDNSDEENKAQKNTARTKLNFYCCFFSIIYYLLV